MTTPVTLKNYIIVPVYSAAGKVPLAVTNVAEQGLELHEVGTEPASNQLWNIDIAGFDGGIFFNVYSAQYGDDYLVYNDTAQGKQVVMTNSQQFPADKFTWSLGNQNEVGQISYYLTNNGLCWSTPNTNPQVGDKITMEPGSDNKNLFVFKPA